LTESLLFILTTIVCFQPNKEGNQAVVTKLNVAAGLGELMCGKYKAAARLFLTANIDHCDFPDVSE
jgi:hypothetical protein